MSSNDLDNIRQSVLDRMERGDKLVRNWNSKIAPFIGACSTPAELG
jgi:hypothetical protein